MVGVKITFTQEFCYSSLYLFPTLGIFISTLTFQYDMLWELLYVLNYIEETTTIGVGLVIRLN
jgi:hypothetical protein